MAVGQLTAYKSLEDAIKLLRKGKRVPPEIRRFAIGEAETIKSFLLLEEERR